jgi:hypothetical protein
LGWVYYKITILIEECNSFFICYILFFLNDCSLLANLQEDHLTKAFFKGLDQELEDYRGRILELESRLCDPNFSLSPLAVEAHLSEVIFF